MRDRNDEKAIRRSAKLTSLSQSYEDYIKEILSTTAAMKQQDVVRMVRDNIKRSIHANIQYHTEMAQEHDKMINSFKATYHRIVAEVYRSLLN